MKKYLIFAWDDFSAGGPCNVRYQTNDIQTAQRMAERCADSWEHVEIYSTETNEVVEVIK